MNTIFNTPGPLIFVLEDVTKGDTELVLQSDVDNVPAVVVTADGDLLITGDIKSHHRESFGEIDEPVS